MRLLPERIRKIYNVDEQVYRGFLASHGIRYTFSRYGSNCIILSFLLVFFMLPISKSILSDLRQLPIHSVSKSQCLIV